MFGGGGGGVLLAIAICSLLFFIVNTNSVKLSLLLLVKLNIWRCWHPQAPTCLRLRTLQVKVGEDNPAYDMSILKALPPPLFKKSTEHNLPNTLYTVATPLVHWPIIGTYASNVLHYEEVLERESSSTNN